MRIFLMMAIPKKHMRRFHWNGCAIRNLGSHTETRFGGNANSKKMQKAVFKQQFEAFTISSSEGLEKGYDRFQQLLSQLEAHGAEVSTEDANHKFLKSLPPAWSNPAMTMRTKPDFDTLSINDLYNNLRVFEQEIQDASKTSLSAQNTCTPSTSSTNTLEKEALAGFADEIDDLDIEEMDINWQIAMIAIRMRKFYSNKKEKKRDSFLSHQEAGNAERIKMGLVLTMDDGIVNWGEHTEDEETNHALMAISSSSKVGNQEANTFAYSQAVTELEAQLDLLELPLNILLILNLRFQEYLKKCYVSETCLQQIATGSETPKVNRKNWNAMKERELGEGYSFTKKKCFVCGSLSHLIKDCDYYEKKMARKAEFKKQRVFNTVQLNTDRPNINSVRPNNTGRTNIILLGLELILLILMLMLLDLDSQYLQGPQPALVLKDHRFSWVFFLASKDETSGILQNFIRQIENQLNHRVKIIRSDNGTEFKNRDMLEFCGNKGIKQEYSNARTPQQNGVAERMNMTLIKDARTMLADSLLQTIFWAKAVSTACYIFNRVRVTKPQNKTPYELLFSHKPIISYIRPFGCHVTILDTLSVLGKFDGKSDEGFLVGYSLNSKAYRVYNLVTKRVEVNLHVNFLEDKPNVKGVGYRWMFDIDYLTNSMNYILVSLENQANPHAGTSEVTNSAGTSQTPTANASEEKDKDVELIVVSLAVKNTAEKEASSTDTSEDNPKILAFRRELEEIALKNLGTVPENNSTTTPSVNYGSEPVNTGRLDPDDSPMPKVKIFHKSKTGIFDEASYDKEGVVTDFNSLPTEIEVSLTPTLRIHNIHPKSQILGDPKSAVQTRSKVQQKSRAHALISYIQKQQRNNHKDQQHCLFACFLSQEEPKKISKALQDDSWVQAMQEELLQFKLQQVWVLVDLPHGMKGRGGINYDEVFAPVARMEAIRDKKDIMLVQVYVDDIIFGSTKKSWCDEFEALRKQISDEFYGSMIGSLMYLTASRPDIMFAVCACSRFQVTPKTSHLNAVKRIFKYLKGKPNLGLWYPRESPFDLEAFSDSDYGGSNLDRKSITGGCQFLRQRLISWQCKKQTIVATSTTEAEYTTTAKTLADGTLELHATIDTIAYTITEASIRSKLKLADASGITMLPNTKIFEGMGHMGSKSGRWDQFGSNIATALICLSTDRVYNFSKLFFDGMVANLKSKTKFLMYPRFLQLILDIQTENRHPYLAVTLTKKIFGNMKRGFRGVPRPLLPAMLSIANPCAGQEASSVTQSQPFILVVGDHQHTTTQPIPSEAITILPLSQPAPPIPIAETTNASPLPTPSPAHELMEHTFEQPSLTNNLLHLDKKLLLPKEETEAQGRKFHDLDPLVSLLQELVTPSKTPSKTVNALGEEQVEDISPTTLEAAAILTKVKKIKSVDKGKRYKRRKSSKESAGTGLDFEEVKSAFEEVNTGGIKVSAGIEEINAGSLDVNTGIDSVTTDSIRVSVPSPDRGRREAIRLDALEKALEKEEVAKQVHLDSLLAQRMAEEQELTEEQKKRKAQVQFEAQSYTATLKNLGLCKKDGGIGTQPTEEKVEEDKDDEPTKKTGKRRKQIARKGFHTHHDKDETEDSDEANEKDNSTSGTKIPINLVPIATKSPLNTAYPLPLDTAYRSSVILRIIPTD
ncbi:putative ribonuclease H-like domain-containing protein [Tanacetum coccineum]